MRRRLRLLARCDIVHDAIPAMGYCSFDGSRFDTAERCCVGFEFADDASALAFLRRLRRIADVRVQIGTMQFQGRWDLPSRTLTALLDSGSN
jgi:hypothetical protein